MNKACQHNINIKDNTMTLYPRRFMVVPDCLYAHCKVCNEQIKYIKNKNGGYDIVKEGADEN